MKNNLIVVAHPDDEILGFGATGKKLVNKGEKVQSIILCGNVEVRNNRPENKLLKQNIMNANNSLGFTKPILKEFPNLKLNNIDHIDLVKSIEEELIRLKPSRIFTHHPNDLNDDHRKVSEACFVASKAFQRKNINDINLELYFMEIQSATEWSNPFDNLQFSPNVFIDITETIESKISALGKYSNVMRDSPHPRSEKMIKALAAFRGSQCGREYAESFQLIFSQKAW